MVIDKFNQLLRVVISDLLLMFLFFKGIFKIIQKKKTRYCKINIKFFKYLNNLSVKFCFISLKFKTYK